MANVRKPKILILMMMMGFLYSTPTISQIQYETSYTHSGSITKLETEGYKFFLMDVGLEQCRVYNTDHTLWKTIQFSVPDNRWLTDIEFLSQHLFDSDDGVEMLYVYYEYVETETSYYYIYTTCIIDDNGSVILEVPGGSWSDIENIEGDGARLMVYVYDYSSFPYSVETKVYKLPGQWTGIPESDPQWGDKKDHSVFPNPAHTTLHVPVMSDLQGNRASVVIMDLGGELILRQPVTSTLEEVDLQSLGLPPGTYFVRLESPMFQTKLQKFIVTN